MSETTVRVLTEEQKAIRTKWCEALRSGKYEQGTGYLRANDKFCCLGVLCDVIDPLEWRFEDNSPCRYGTYEGDSMCLSGAMLNSVGLSAKEQDRLIDLLILMTVSWTLIT